MSRPSENVAKPAAKAVKGFASPLLGYNTNARYKGKIYHIQTEDSGVQRPHIMTHLFADGGRIIASRKCSYAEHVGAENYREIVKKLMQEQHKAMFIALRDGTYDDQLTGVGESPEYQALSKAPAAQPQASAKPALPSRPAVAAPAAPPVGKFPREHTGEFARKLSSQYPAAAAGRPAVVPQRDRALASIFEDTQLLSEKSLDEVILGYLAEEWDEE